MCKIFLGIRYVADKHMYIRPLTFHYDLDHDAGCRNHQSAYCLIEVNMCVKYFQNFKSKVI